MANRNWANGGKIMAMHVAPVLLDATAQIGAAGAVSSITGAAVKSITHLSTGIYKIKMQDNYSKMFAASSSMQSPASALSGVLAIEIQHSPNASVVIADGAELTIKCLDAAGALVDPATGSAINVMMLMSNSSVMIQGE